MYRSLEDKIRDLMEKKSPINRDRSTMEFDPNDQIQVGTYKTKNFEVSRDAQKLLSQGIPKDSDEISAEQMAIYHDKLFDLVKQAMVKKRTTKDDVETAENHIDKIKQLAKNVGIEDKVNYLDQHLDKIKKHVDDDTSNVVNKTNDDAANVDKADTEKRFTSKPTQYSQEPRDFDVDNSKVFAKRSIAAQRKIKIIDDEYRPTQTGDLSAMTTNISEKLGLSASLVEAAKKVMVKKCDCCGKAEKECECNKMNEESVLTGTRKITIFGDSTKGHSTQVRYNKDWNEYQVHHYWDGKHLGEGPVSYHGEDKEDAMSTAKHTVEDPKTSETYNPRRKSMDSVKEESREESYIKAATKRYVKDRKSIDDAAPHGNDSTADPKLKRSVRNRFKGLLRAGEKLNNEEVEQIDELDKSTGRPTIIGNYLGKVTAGDLGIARPGREKGRDLALAKLYGKAKVKAVHRTRNEEVEQMDEATHVAYLKPKDSAPSHVKDHFDLPVDSADPKKAHAKFRKLFGNMAKHYEVVHVKPKMNEEAEQIDEGGNYGYVYDPVKHIASMKNAEIEKRIAGWEEFKQKNPNRHHRVANDQLAMLKVERANRMINKSKAIGKKKTNEEVEQIDEGVKVGPKNYDKSTDTVWHIVHHNGEEIGTIGTISAPHVEKYGKWGFEDSRGYGRKHGQPMLNSKKEALDALVTRHKEYTKTNEEVEQIDEIKDTTRTSWINKTFPKHFTHSTPEGIREPTEGPMSAARKKIYDKAVDKSDKIAMKKYEDEKRQKREAREPQVHDLRHMSHGEVYDETQTNSKIKDGDVLRVEGGTAAMVGAWPTMIHGKSDTLHSFKNGVSIHDIEGGSYHKTGKLADKVHGLKEEQIEEGARGDLARKFRNRFGAIEKGINKLGGATNTPRTMSKLNRAVSKASDADVQKSLAIFRKEEAEQIDEEPIRFSVRHIPTGKYVGSFQHGRGFSPTTSSGFKPGPDIKHLPSGHALVDDDRPNVKKPNYMRSPVELYKGNRIKESVEQIDEKFKLFQPGDKVTVSSIDRFGFFGRDQHPPVDGSMDGHKVRITGYPQHYLGKYGVEGGDRGNRRFQSVMGKVLTGEHKGKEFEFIHHELVKEHVEEILSAKEIENLNQIWASLEEGRGRPPKEGSEAWKRRQAELEKGGTGEEEPDTHIMVQVKKAADQDEEAKKPFTVVFHKAPKDPKTGKPPQHPLPKHHAQKIWNKYMSLKPSEKEAFQNRVEKSHAALMAEL